MSPISTPHNAATMTMPTDVAITNALTIRRSGQRNEEVTWPGDANAFAFELPMIFWGRSANGKCSGRGCLPKPPTIANN